MAPVRTKEGNNEGEGSTSKGKGKQVHKKKKQHHHQPKATAIPGKQKIKAALRQAKRLLAKVGFLSFSSCMISKGFLQDKLAADKRVETERRIKALEADLEHAEQAEKERTMAVRYHKVKFFGTSPVSDMGRAYAHNLLMLERKKVTRKISQIKKQMESAEGSGKDQLTAQLLEERVNLNYILVRTLAFSLVSI